MRKTVSALAAAIMLTGALTSCGFSPISLLRGDEEQTATATETSTTTTSTDGSSTTKTTRARRSKSTSTTTEAVTTDKSGSKTGTTTSKSKNEKTTTTSKAKSGIGDYNNIQTSTGDIVGKWYFDEFDLEDLDLSEGAGLMLKPETYIQFNSDNTIEMYEVIEGDSALSIDESKVYLSGFDYDYDYDGSTISAMGTSLFERIGDPDPNSVYGKYKYASVFADDSLSDEASIVINFIGPGKSTLEALLKGTYSFDKESGQLKMDITGQDPIFEDEGAKCVVLDDELIIIDESGDSITMHRG